MYKLSHGYLAVTPVLPLPVLQVDALQVLAAETPNFLEHVHRVACVVRHCMVPAALPEHGRPVPGHHIP